MNRAIVPKPAGSRRVIDDVLEDLSLRMETMSPQVRKAAAFVLDTPDAVGLASVRELADAAGVKPNTLVRMARAAGFGGFEDFREPFREELRSKANTFPDKAQWLQDLSAGGSLGNLFTDIAGSAVENVERMFSSTSAEEMRVIADLVVRSRRTYVIGVGANYALAHNFAYLVGMAVEHVMAVPNEGNVPMDTIVRAGSEDVVVAMTFEPYRSEVVDATAAARAQGARVVAITDSHGSPIAVGADHVVIAPSSTPQFFPSTLAASAALETLASFIVADADPTVVAAIDRFHRRRYELGVYVGEDA